MRSLLGIEENDSGRLVWGFELLSESEARLAGQNSPYWKYTDTKQNYMDLNSALI